MILADPTTSVPIPIANSEVTTLESETDCVLNRSLEIFNTNSLKWETYEDAMNSDYSWIDSWTDPVGSGPVFETSTNSFDIYTEDFATFDNENSQPAVFQLRMKVEDYYSKKDSATVFDYFNVQIKFECDDDVVTLLSDITMFVYSSTSAAPDTIDANFEQSISGCEMIYKAEVRDPVYNEWYDITDVGTTPNNDYPWATDFIEGTLEVETTTAYSPY